MKNGILRIRKDFSSNTSASGLISRLYKELNKLNIKKQIRTNWGADLNRKFSKVEAQMTKKYIKKHSTSSVIIEIQIKTTL